MIRVCDARREDHAAVVVQVLVAEAAGRVAAADGGRDAGAQAALASRKCAGCMGLPAAVFVAVAHRSRARWIAFVSQTRARRVGLVVGKFDGWYPPVVGGTWPRGFREHRTTHTVVGYGRKSASGLSVATEIVGAEGSRAAQG